MSRGATFVGPTAQQMASHPSPSASGDPYPGPIIGVDIDSNRPFRFDPAWLMDNGIINAPTSIVIAAIREGKSAIIKLMVKRLMMLAPGGRALTGVINDYRPEGDGTEYSKLAEYLGCTVFRMKDMRFNILDKRLYLNDKGEVSEFALIEMVRRVAEFEQQPLDDIEMAALRIAMREQMKLLPELWGFDYIAGISGGIIDEMYMSLREQGHRLMADELDARLAKVQDPELKRVLHEQHSRVMALPDNVRLDDIVAAGVRLRNRLENVYDGIAGDVFGRDYSYYDLMTQQLTVRDWRGLTPAAERLLRLAIGRLDIAAIDNNRFDQVSGLLVDDELHRAMRNPQFVEDRLYQQQISRSLSRFEIAGTHSLDSIRAGEPGSKIYRESQTIINNTGCLWFGRLPKEGKLQEEAKTYGGLTDYEVWRLTTAPKYCFGVKLNPAEPMRMIRATPFGGDIALIDTDSATRAKAEKDVLRSTEALEAFAQQNGVRYIGGE